MKRKIINFILLFCFGWTFSQLSIGNDKETQHTNIVPFPTTANAYSLDKVGKLNCPWICLEGELTYLFLFIPSV
ncbi:Uncharacterised protein [Chryseobacterium nakagawai]|nr:Uncharacterised protein [Chryseobacterium nakagawai]